MRFLHTADWQLGAKLGQVGTKAGELRRRRIQAAEKAIQAAVEAEVDFVVIAGDTFEHQDVDGRVVREAVRLLDELGSIAVYVLPGNHDPLVPGGIWDRSAWTEGEHVHLLATPEPVEVGEDVVLYPCPLEQKQSNLDPTRWIPAREDGDDRIRIGVAHGALDVLPEARNFPIDAERPDLAGLDYLALGDWHSRLERGRSVYPGTIEQSAHGQKDPGNVLLVEFEEAGADPEVEVIRVGQMTWIDRALEVQDVTDVHSLEEELGTDPEKRARLVLRLNLAVTSDAVPETLDELNRVHEELAERVFHLDWTVDDSAFFADVPVDLPEGLVSRIDETLRTILDRRIPEGPGRDFADSDEDVVREARALLRRIARSRIP